MPQTYFTADWHFSHPNIALYCPQFRLQSDSADELNEYLIDCWNRVVTPQDTVYNLGDVCFAKKQKDGFLIRPFRISNTAKCTA